MEFNSSFFGNVVKMDGGHQRGRMTKSAACECMVSLTGKKNKEIVFRFYKGSDKRIFGGLNRGTFGIFGSRIYFRGSSVVSDSISIYSKNGKSNNKELKLRLIKSETIDLMKKYVGSYNFEFDNESGFYYIDTDNKLA